MKYAETPSEIMNTEPPKELTQEEKRIKIAKAIGWKKCFKNKIFKNRPCGTDPALGYIQEIPDYFNSLDACAEFEKTLTEDECFKYNDDLLDRVVGRASPYKSSPWIWFSSAEDRAEAFGIVKGLWE